MEEKRSFPEQFMGSIFSFETYRYFFRRSLGRAILYLFLASILLAGLGSIRFLVDLNSGIDEFIRAMERDMPNFELRNGELTVYAEMPYVVSESAEHIFVIDTTGQLDQNILNDYDVGIFLTKHDMFQKQNRFEVRHFDLNAFADLTITRADLARLWPALKWMVPFVALFGFIFYFIGKLLSALVISTGGLIITSATQRKIGFGELYKLSLYALTLPMIIQMVLTLAQIAVPFFFIIYYGIALFYLHKAVITIREIPGPVN